MFVLAPKEGLVVLLVLILIIAVFIVLVEDTVIVVLVVGTALEVVVGVFDVEVRLQGELVGVVNAVPVLVLVAILYPTWRLSAGAAGSQALRDGLRFSGLIR